MLFAYFGVAGSIKSPTLSQLSAVFSDAKLFNFCTISLNEFAIFDELNCLLITNFENFMSLSLISHAEIFFIYINSAIAVNFRFISFADEQTFEFEFH